MSSVNSEETLLLPLVAYLQYAVVFLVTLRKRSILCTVRGTPQGQRWSRL